MRTMWFGTKQYSRWIKVHSPNSGYVQGSYSDRLDYLNGLTSVRTSFNGHMEYVPTWNRLTQDEAMLIADFKSGIFGNGPFYLVEPSAMQTNVLNKAWSAPGLAAKDAVPIAGSVRPELVSNPDQSQGYPVDMAKYTLSASDASRSFYVPIPPGFIALIGAHGDTASTLKVRVQPTVKGVASGSATLVSVLGVNTAARFSNQFIGGDQTGIEISLQTGAAGFITLAGMMVWLVPTTFAGNALGTFISGQGSSGLQFEGGVQPVPYSLAHDSFGLSIKLVETEDAR